MSAKAKPTELPHTFKIYIPTECVCGELLPETERNEVLDDVKATLSGWFGGATTSRVEGSWEHTDGRLAKEPVDVLTSYATSDAAEERHEEFTELVADLANRLTQAGVLCEVNAKGIVYDATALPKPHRCMGGGTRGSLPVPRQDSENQRLFRVEAALQQLSDVRDARNLFCRVLHYDFEDEQLATVNWPDELKKCLAPGTAPQIIADQNGFKILYLQLAEKYLRKGSERQLVQRIIRDDPTLRGLVVVSDVEQKEWHLVNAKFEKEEGKNERLRLRRMRVGPKQSVRTAVERLAMVDIETAGEETTAAELQDLHDRAFDVEKVSKDFFNDISNWYFWALSEVEFPDDTVKDGDDEKHRATSLIRFLTRMIFCWFLKEKDLIPESLFREKDLADILSDLDPDSSTYHQGILQNLFFATLNQRMGKDKKTGQPYRAFAKDEGFAKNRSTYGVDTLYRYEEHFQDEDTALTHFAEVPFLNGGLFECLDRYDDDGKKHYVDGFSRNKKKRARVPNRLFFSGEQTVDLSEAYGDTGRRNAKVRGLLNILHSYNFTVEENTPIDEEIALDPELLGKVFENLLASYNDETKTTARKQTGSFYTPRPIVEYMVDESLKAHLCGTLTELDRKEEEAREQLDLLLGYTDEEPSFSEKEIGGLLESIHTCKILDPACGSGAFPIGMLQKLVHVVHKLDPGNTRWKQLQIDQAAKIPDSSARNAATKAIECDFEENGDDYGRKLYLIENCLYGVDIQPIAVQISKLRFFISLICDQNTNRDKAKNHGVRALPNLETKFVAANTLIGLPEFNEELLPERVLQIESEIESLYHRHFSIQRRDQKLGIQSKLKSLRQELGQVLSESLGSSQKAQHLADWDPFDSQASSDFFDPHWMFGRELAEGFDVVIGNPPYGAEIGEGQKEYIATNYVHQDYQLDSYLLFIERGVTLLRAAGVQSLIIPNTWLPSVMFKSIRRFVFGDTCVLSVANVETKVFAAVVDNNILTHSNEHPKNRIFPVVAYAADGFTEKYQQKQSEWFSTDGTPVSIVLTPEKRAIANQISTHLTIDALFQITPGCKLYQRGKGRPKQTAETVKTKPFTSDSQVDPSFRPLLRGKLIRRYEILWDRNLWIKFGEWLAEPRLTADHDAVQKIVLRQTGDSLIGALDNSQFVVMNNMFTIVPKSPESPINLALAALNSSTLNWYYQNVINPEVGEALAEIKKGHIVRLPLPEDCASDADIFDTLVPLIQIAKAKDETSAALFFEALIDACVMECYFREHMAERDLLFLEDLAPQLDGYDPNASEEKQRDFLDRIHSALNTKGSKIRDRLDRIYSDSPDLLAVIKAEAKA